MFLVVVVVLILVLVLLAAIVMVSILLVLVLALLFPSIWRPILFRLGWRRSERPLSLRSDTYKHILSSIQLGSILRAFFVAKKHKPFSTPVPPARRALPRHQPDVRHLFRRLECVVPTIVM